MGTIIVSQNVSTPGNRSIASSNETVVAGTPGIFDANGVELLGFDLDGSAYFRPSIGATNNISNAMMSAREIACWGDSMTASVFSSLVAALPGRTLFNGGKGGQNSEAIAIRQGGKPLTITVTGNTIPASGSVAITAKNVNILYDGGVYTGSATGSLYGLLGTITTDPSGNWTFTRSTPGISFTCPAGSEFILDEPLAHRHKTCVIWSGRNDGSSTRAQLVASRDNIMSMVNYMRKSIKRYIVISVCNGNGETTGSGAHTNITNLNKELAETFGSNYIDLRAYMVNRAIYDAGITPTGQDTTDMAGDTIPASLRSDNVHFNAAGNTQAAGFIARQLAARGF